jgi:hypothetical protein
MRDVALISVWDNNVLSEVGDSEKHQTARKPRDFQNILKM